MHGQISTFLFSICVSFVYLLCATLYLPTFIETDNRKMRSSHMKVFQQGNRHMLFVAGGNDGVVGVGDIMRCSGRGVADGTGNWLGFANVGKTQH